MKCKTRAFFILAIIVATALSSCARSPGPSPLVGLWESELDTLTVEFFANNTGIERYGEDEFAFRWKDNDGMLEMDFIGNADNSPLNSILTLVVHGETVGSFAFTVAEDGRVLLLSDTHDHGHFELPFFRRTN